MTTRLYRTLLVAVCINQGVLQSDILLTLSEEYVPENSTAILTCSKKGGTLVETKWENSMLPNQEAGCARLGNKCIRSAFLLNNDLYECSCNDDGTYSVHLKRVDRYQQGAIWSCRDLYSTSHNVVIEVLVQVTNALLHASDNGTVSENSLATFTCNTSFSQPRARIRWYRSNASSVAEIVNEHITREEYSRDGVISIEETLNYRVNRAFDGWNVYCSATNWNNNLVMSNTTSLFVLFPPDRPPVIHNFTNGSTYKVMENQPASLSCSVEGGNPLGKPEWLCKELINSSLKETIKDNKTMTTNLTWTAKRNQGKACICRTMHVLSKDFVSVDIDVLYTPDVPKIELLYKNFKTTTQDAKLIETQSYRFLCSADGNPLPTKYIWSRRQKTETTVNNSIDLPNVQRNQRGTYSCQAQNIMIPTYGGLFHGKNIIKINVDVLYEPTIAVLKNYNCVEYSSLNVTCNAILANPNKTVAIWTRDKQDWNITSNHLIIQNISRHDSMNYTCTMRNYMIPTVGSEEEGSDNKTFYLNVWYGASVKKFLVHGHENENPVSVNESTMISFTCEMDSNPISSVTINSPSGKILGRSNTSIIEQRYLMFSCHDSGVYSCSGGNEYNHGQQARADITVVVNCKPMANASVQEDIRSELYVPVTLKVSIIAYPEPQFTWELWNITSWQPIHNNSMYSMSSSGMQSELRVNNYTSKELNMFHVIVKNFVGTLTHNYTLQPYDRPNQPTELNHIPDLLTDTSITVTWKPGFNGGTLQNFSIGYKSTNFHDWDTIIVQDTGDAVMNLTLKELKSSTYYVFEIFAVNIKGSSDKLVLRLQTKAPKATSTPPAALIAGSVSSVIVSAVAIAIGILLYKKRGVLTQRKESETGRLIYQNVPFSVISGRNIKKPQRAKERTDEETSFHGLQELDDAAPLMSEPTEYYNSPENIEQIKIIRVSELLAYVSSRSEESFGIDYQKLPTGLQHPCTFARRPENIALNRYNGIYPYDHSRVKISGQPDFFINACYIDGYRQSNAYVASLGPTGKTTYDFKTFWMMVWNEQSDIIVMLTNLTEPSGMKCEQYWPNLGSRILYGDIQVLCEREDVFAEYTTRFITISKADNRRRITHLHYTAWPDKKVPEDVTTLIEFRERLKETRSSKSGPIVVHCSAGIGRTGTLIALDRLIEEGQCDFSVDVFKCVNSMREQRVKMVQTLEQYIYIYKALVNSLYFDCEMIPLETFQEYLDETNNNIYSTQFQQLKESVETCKKVESDARSANKKLVHKNRQGADIPGSQHRVYLYINRKIDDTDYINAVYINSFRKKDHFITAQSPLPDTVSDFICMIYQEDCCCVITMEDLKDPGMNVGQFLPSDGRTFKYGDMNISCTTLETKPQYTVTEMRIKNSGKHAGGEKAVYHFQYNKWMQGNDTPEDAKEFVEFVKDVEDYADQLGEETSHVLVHCLKANERSALYCVVTILMEKIRYERQVSVLNTVRHLRTRRRSAITSMEQLKFCYQAVSAYISLFEP